MVCVRCVNVSVVEKRKDEKVKRGGGCGGRMEVDVSEANSRVGCGAMDGRAVVDGAMDGCADVDGAMDGCADVDGAMDGCAGVDGAMNGRAGVDGKMDGCAGVDGVMDGRAGVDGVMDGHAGDKKGSGCVGCEVKYGWVNWAGNGNMGVGRIGR